MSDDGANALAALIRARIAADGPMRLDAYMALCLGHPEFGYYATRDPLGATGDFTTAPEISQIFGELLGLWAAQTWMDLGGPPEIRLVEIGPGRGTLMADMLRAAAAAPAFRAAVRPILVETSPTLRAIQHRRLADAGALWIDRFVDAADGPLIVVANEFFDALPVRQFVRRGATWRERAVDVRGDALAWTEIDGAPDADRWPDAPEGAVLDICEDGEATAHDIGARIARDGGAALFVDYAYTAADRAAAGGRDTLQAVRAHRFADPLAAPGSADLTAHVDFSAVAAAAERAGARAWGPIGQGSLLRRLGAEARAARLAQAAPARAEEIAAGLHRLVDPAEMGALFRALALTGPAAGTPAGFEEA